MYILKYTQTHFIYIRVYTLTHTHVYTYLHAFTHTHTGIYGLLPSRTIASQKMGKDITHRTRQKN